MQSKMKRLHQYSLLSATLLIGVTKSDGQVIYTDLEPDFDFDFLFKNLDLDDNGTNDFKFVKEELGSYNSSDIICYSTLAWGVDRIAIGNSIIGIDQIYTNDLITPLNYGHLIADEDNHFNGDTWQFLTFKRRERTCLYYLPDSPWFYPNIGGWHTNEGEDKYIGVKFNGDTPDCYYYGWIRCVISDSLEEMIIKDFAYNADCGAGLLAGTLISSLEAHNQNDPIITVQNNTICIKVAENVIGAAIIITALTGQVVHNSTISTFETFISSEHFSVGMYIINIEISGQQFVGKIMIP